MSILVLILLLGFFVGTPLASLLTKIKGEQYYFWRAYEFYKRGQTDMVTLILKAIVNTIFGLVVLLLIGAELFDKWWQSINKL